MVSSMVTEGGRFLHLEWAAAREARLGLGLDHDLPRSEGRTFVSCPQGSELTVAGYYSLAASPVVLEQAPGSAPLFYRTPHCESLASPTS